MDWTSEQTDSNVVTVRWKVPSPYPDWAGWVLLRSDAHHDNPKCDQKMERRHLKLARQRGAVIIDNGDLFCAMQGKYDKRSSKSDIRPEHQAGNYLDRLVSTAADFYEPYAENFVVLGHGNHETSIKTRHETDLTRRLAERLGPHIQAGNYGGFVRFQFDARTRSSKLLHYFHGSGGGGPVTKDMIQMTRRTEMMDGVDIICTGHTHDMWTDRRIRCRVTDSGKFQQHEVRCIKLGTYKDDYGNGAKGWAVERAMPPKPLGAWWLKFTYRNKRVRMEVMEAA